MRTISPSPRREAQCSAVMPSPCAALTSSPAVINARTAAASALIAASATFDPSKAHIHEPVNITAASATASLSLLFIVESIRPSGRLDLVQVHRAGAVAEPL